MTVAKKTDSKKKHAAVNSKEKQKFLRIITALIIICLSLIVCGLRLHWGFHGPCLLKMTASFCAG